MNGIVPYSVFNPLRDFNEGLTSDLTQYYLVVPLFSVRVRNVGYFFHLKQWGIDQSGDWLQRIINVLCLWPWMSTLSPVFSPVHLLMLSHRLCRCLPLGCLHSTCPSSRVFIRVIFKYGQNFINFSPQLTDFFIASSLEVRIIPRKKIQIWWYLQQWTLQARNFEEEEEEEKANCVWSLRWKLQEILKQQMFQINHFFF